MKRIVPFILLLAAIACTSGFLLSKASWIGRVGMTFFYKEYNFMKVWWQGAIAVFLVFMVLILFHGLLFRRLPLFASRILHVLFFFAAAAGLYFTYDDFSNEMSHRLLGHRFHLGFYLVWIGWMLIAFFFLGMKKKKVELAATNEDKKEPTNS